MKRIVSSNNVRTPLINAAEAYAQNPNASTYDELKQCIFDNERQDIVEELLALKASFAHPDGSCRGRRGNRHCESYDGERQFFEIA